MIIVHISQQLGNQMFQYALGRQLEMLGKEVKYCLKYYDKHPEHDLALSGFFHLDLPKATEEEIQAVWDVRSRIVNRVIKKISGVDRMLIHELSMECIVRPFNRRALTMKQGILNGYWQSEKYFSQIADVIYKDFKFPEPSLRNRELGKEMSENLSVSIHVRRGDYNGLYPLLTEEYYEPAMTYFREKYGDVRFYAFSNDIAWCREHLQAERLTYVDWNTGTDSPYDMWLMTQCKHNIIANSTFSWWGAWLNRNEGREVIAPKKWDFYLEEHPDLYCPDWIVL